jgi:hypothetical protein
MPILFHAYRRYRRARIDAIDATLALVIAGPSCRCRTCRTLTRSPRASFARDLPQDLEDPAHEHTRRKVASAQGSRVSLLAVTRSSSPASSRARTDAMSASLGAPSISMAGRPQLLRNSFRPATM